MNRKLRHIGVYGIIAIDKQILLIKKARGPYIGLLDLPGGSPEFYESFEETLYREVLEETGLKVRDSRPIFTILNIGKYENVELRHVGVIYSVKANGNAKLDLKREDSNGCVWTNVDTIEEKKCSPFAFKAVLLLRNQVS
jgi:ADP-ribose pyrophosphatase YjhB (NUDIX family)